MLRFGLSLPAGFGLAWLWRALHGRAALRCLTVAAAVGLPVLFTAQEMLYLAASPWAGRNNVRRETLVRLCALPLDYTILLTRPDMDVPAAAERMAVMDYRPFREDAYLPAWRRQAVRQQMQARSEGQAAAWRPYLGGRALALVAPEHANAAALLASRCQSGALLWQGEGFQLFDLARCAAQGGQ